MSESCNPLVTLSRCSATGIGTAARRNNESFGCHRALAGRDSKTVIRPADVCHCFVDCEEAAASLQPAEKGPQHIGGLVADRKDLSGRLGLGQDAFGLDQFNEVARAQSGEGRVQELPLLAKRLDDAVRVGGLGEVAAGPPDMRILTPGRRFFSSRRVLCPRSAARVAASNPAAPAPTTTTSQSCVSKCSPAI